MTRSILFAAPAWMGISLILAGAALAAPADITKPGDPITLVNGVDDGDGNSGPPPAAEGVERAIDNIGQKYLNFLDLGSGFVVQPSVGSTLVTGLTFYTANDAEERDPASYLLEGSHDGTNFSTISSGALALPSGRNLGGSTALTSASFHQDVTFANSAAYEYYRVTFPTLKNAAAANSMHIAEVEILGLVPEPTSLGLLGVGALGLLRRRLRQR